MKQPSSYLLAVSFIAASILMVPRAAEASELELSAKAGGNWSLLSKPSDARGEPTLMNGAPFDGAGFTFGAGVHYPLHRFRGGLLELEAGLLYSSHNGEGFEADAASGEERTVTLSAEMLRVPVLIHLRNGSDHSGVRVGVGLEAMFGLNSAASVETNSAVGAPSLETTSTSHLGATVAVGLDWRAGRAWSIPFELRATFDPFVADNTRERFDAYRSLSDTGRYRVAYDWQLFLMTGVRFGL